VRIPDSDNHIIQGKWIGLNGTGSDSLSNGSGETCEYTDNIQIDGDAGLGEGDVVGGNVNDGVYGAFGSTACLIQGNLIGLDAATGSSALGNGHNGVRIESCFDTQVGSPVANLGNVISGQDGSNGVG